MRRVVVFGATGYTGALTARALVARGVTPVLAGRSPEKLARLSAELGGAETRVADVEDAASMRRLVSAGDVLVTTVGPFSRVGEAALEAATAVGADYVDSTGEIAFARKAIEEYGPRAAAKGCSLHTACGYDFVPGHCVAAVAVRRAAEAPAKIAIGYFASRGAIPELSQGTRASIAGVMLRPGWFFRDGRLVEEWAGTEVRRFSLDGVPRPAVSISSTEHLHLPRLFPSLRDVEVYLGWFGQMAYAVPTATRALALLRRVPALDALLERSATRLAVSEGKGPSEETLARVGSHIVALAYDRAGRELSRAELRGVHGYLFTARIIAVFADWLARGRSAGRGALDPVSAFGLDALVDACRESGLTLDTEPSEA